VHNSKAFLEGLIVNEVLTKTASFEKLAFPPIYAVPPALQAAYYAWRRWIDSPKSLPVDGGANSRRSGLDVHPQPPAGVGNNVGRGVPKGRSPSRDEIDRIIREVGERFFDK
jgi:hypothetical protein